MKFRTDEWVWYCQFPDMKSLQDEKVRSVVLAVLTDDPIYDYRICLDDGSRKIINVREKHLEVLNEDA